MLNTEKRAPELWLEESTHTQNIHEYPAQNCCMVWVFLLKAHFECILNEIVRQKLNDAECEKRLENKSA